MLAREGAIARGPVEDLRRQIQAAEARGRAAQAAAAERVVRAPFAGTVGLRDLSPGALVTPGAEIATLDNIDTLRVRFTLPERDIGRVQVGNTVQVTSPAFPGRVFTGRVSSFDSRLDPQQRTLQVEARLPNPDRSLRPGMLANVRIGAERNERALVVPAVAVQLRGAERPILAAAINLVLIALGLGAILSLPIRE